MSDKHVHPIFAAILEGIFPSQEEASEREEFEDLRDSDNERSERQGDLIAKFRREV